MCVSRRCPHWRCVHLVWAAVPGLEPHLQGQGARSSPSTTRPRPCTPPRAVAMSCFLVLARASRFASILAKPQESLTATPNPKYDPRAGSSDAQEDDRLSQGYRKLTPDPTLLLRFWCLGVEGRCWREKSEDREVPGLDNSAQRWLHEPRCLHFLLQPS